MTTTPVNSASELQRERRHAVRAALRSGDPLLVVRATARARVAHLHLDPQEQRRARAARRRVGRAIRAARRPVLVAGEVAPARPTAKRGVRVSRRVAALFATALGILVGVALPTPAALPTAPSEPPAAAEPSSTMLPIAEVAFGGGGGGSVVSFGRVVNARAVVVTPAPTAPPTASPSPKRSPASFAPGATPSAGPGGGGGTGPTGPPVQTLGPLQPGFIRVLGYVYDANTGRPLAGACLRLGFGCFPLQTYTSTDGLFIIDLPIGDGSIAWDLAFEHLPEYVSVHITLDPSRSRVRYLGIVYLHRTG